MIQINLLRVSPDSQYLEFSVECPTDYRFNKLYIKRYDGEGTYSGLKDCSHLLQATTTKEVMRIATTAFGGSTLFYVTFGVTYVGTGTPVEIADVTGACSDVNAFYQNIVNGIIDTNTKFNQSVKYDDVIRRHIVLYAHTEAMRLERYTEAELFYGIIKKLVTNII